MVSSNHENHKSKGRKGSEMLNPEFHVDILYERVDSYRVMEEKALYTWNQLACEIGGFLGLVMGASILSLVEVITYVTLVTVKYFL